MSEFIDYVLNGRKCVSKICKNVSVGLEAGQVSMFLSHGREVCTCRDTEEVVLEEAPNGQ